MAAMAEERADDYLLRRQVSGYFGHSNALLGCWVDACFLAGSQCSA